MANEDIKVEEPPADLPGSKVKCLTCGTIIQSMNPRDTQSCHCSRETRITIGGGGRRELFTVGPKANWEFLPRRST